MNAIQIIYRGIFCLIQYFQLVTVYSNKDIQMYASLKMNEIKQNRN